MPGTFTYGLYPWQWLTEAGQSFHAPPALSRSVLDFRPISEQAKASQSGGWGFFAWPDGVAVPNDLVSLGVGYISEIQASTAARDEMRIKLGLGPTSASNPVGSTLVDCIADILGAKSDPTGANGPKPLMPPSGGTLEIQLAGHSRVWSLMLDKANLLAANPNSRNNRIRDVIRAGIDTADEVGGLELASKVLGSWLLTCGLSREEIKLGAPGKKTQWERLLSTKLKAKHGAAMKPKEPKTSFSESWPNATGDIEATAQDNTWVTVTNTFAVVAGKLRATANFGTQTGTCQSAVSSANHEVVLQITATGQPIVAGPTARSSAAADTYYSHEYSLAEERRKLFKCVAGVRTQLASVAVTFTIGDTFVVYPDGSTITGGNTQNSDQAVTDTAITDGLKGGVTWYSDTNNHTFSECDTWTIDDFLPAAPVAAFSGTPLSGTSPLSVVFTDSSTNTPTSWLWEKSSDAGSNWSNFASGPTTQNPTESFAAGTWAVRLTATNAGGSNAKTETDYVVVTAAGGAGVSALMLVRGFV